MRPTSVPGIALFGVLLAILVAETSAINCLSRLVLLFPNRYPQCKQETLCRVLTWNGWQYIRTENTAVDECPSRRRYVLEREGNRASPRCKQLPPVERKYICELTSREKAERFIEALKLGNNVDSDGSANITSYRGRRHSGFVYPCPSNISNAEKLVCESITDSCSYYKRRKRRSLSEQERTNLADFLISQEDSKRGERIRKAFPDISRNVMFVVDSSGSIYAHNFNRVKNVLAQLTVLFCGEIGFGMMQFGTNVWMEFCPKCFRMHTEDHLALTVSDRIHGMGYKDAGSTSTGGAIDCLTNYILNSTGCLDTVGKPTQLVFLTDGQANRCRPPSDALSDLIKTFPHIESYAIGVGNIDRNGIIDLLVHLDPQNVFNIPDIDALELLFSDVIQELDRTQKRCKADVKKKSDYETATLTVAP